MGIGKPESYNAISESYKMNKNIARAAAAVSLAAVSVSSFAADQGTDAISALGAQATTYITAAFTVAVLVAGGFWGIKMMKKAFSKAG